jgi:tetratricopeptide (TPR) repeat protein
MVDQLRALWDFDDLPGSEARFLELLDSAQPAEHPEILTQLARVKGLQGDFEAGHQLVDQAEQLAGDSSAAAIRVLLERGRLHRSSGLPDRAGPLFVEAFDQGMESGQIALAVDAAHMAALVEDMDTWTERGLEIARQSDDPDVTRWLGPLLNNLGWDRFDAGDFQGALQAFESALREYEKPPDRPSQVKMAREAVEEAQRAIADSSLPSS